MSKSAEEGEKPGRNCANRDSGQRLGVQRLCGPREPRAERRAERNVAGDGLGGLTGVPGGL